MIQEYVTADSRKLVDIYNDRCFPKADIVITSPPYFDVKSYDEINYQIGYKQTYQEYISDTTNVLQQCHTVSNENATLWLIVDTIQRNGMLYPIPFDINKSLTERSVNNDSKQKTWILRDVIIWYRAKNLPWSSKGHLKHEFEYILFFIKSNDYKYYLDNTRNVDYISDWWLTYPERYNSIGRPPSNVWDFTIPIRGWGNGYQQHLCPLPFPLIERILNLSSDKNDVVLDPFAGSGSVIALAKVMQRHAIGFDINSNYKKKFESDVVIGANKYYENRVIELEKEEKKRKLFKDTNNKLRKIKAGIKVVNKIKNSINNKKNKYLILDNINDSSSVNVVILQEESESTNSISDITEYLQKIKAEYYIEVKITHAEKNIETINNYNSKVFYAYTPKKIYNYSDTFSALQIMTGKYKSNYVFSNIELCIDKPQQFFD